MTNHPDLVASSSGSRSPARVMVPINARYRTTELRFDRRRRRPGRAAHARRGRRPRRLHRADRARRSPDARARTIVMMGAREPDGIVSRAEFDSLATADDAAAAYPHRGPTRARHRADPLHVRHDHAPRGAILSHEAFVRDVDVDRAHLADDRRGPPLDRAAALPRHRARLPDVGAGDGATFISDYISTPAARCTTLVAERVTEFYPAYQPVMEAIVSHPDFADDRPEPDRACSPTSPRPRCSRSSSARSRTRSS